MIRRSILPSGVILLAAGVLAADPQAESAAISYVQATVSEPNPQTGSLGFVTASGRARAARVSGAARARLANLRPGDEVILTLEGPAERPVITGVKVSSVVPAPAPEATAGITTAAMPMVGGVPSRPSWPNPYSRINPGLPPRPTRMPRGGAARVGTLSVMPARFVATAASAPMQPVAAPAVLTAVPAAPPSAPRTETPSDMDALRARGAREFEAAVTRLAADARAVDAVYARYESSCPPVATAGDGSRAWLGLTGAASVAAADAGCAALLEDIQRLGAPVKAGMMAAQEAARRAWVLPGTLTDIRRRHAMEWSGF